MRLSKIFSAVVYKRFVAVDLPGRGSNQHELNGVAKLKRLFGSDEKVRGNINWRFFADDEPILEHEDKFTFYDARSKSLS